MESSTENNQIHRSVLLDHKMVIEGITYHEKKEMQRIFNEDGVEMSNLSHMRSIGVRTYTANQKIVDGEVKDETIETNLAEDEIAAFRKDWEDNWHPEDIDESDESDDPDYVPSNSDTEGHESEYVSEFHLTDDSEYDSTEEYL